MLYSPPHFRETDAARLLDEVSAGTGFATLISNAPDGPVVTPLPLVHDAGAGGLGRFIGHVARANPHWKVADLAVPSVILFTGPDAYISPGWYATKTEHGKVVPTWNYVAIHVTADLIVHDDTDWLRDAVTRLTNRHEEGRTEPWGVTDAPADFIGGQLKGIVGIELIVRDIVGKRKLSQNRSVDDQAGVRAGLSAEEGDGPAAVRAAMTALQSDG